MHRADLAHEAIRLARMVHAQLPEDGEVAGLLAHHRLLSVRAHLLEKTGDTAGAYELYRRAAKSTASIAEQRYLESRAGRVRP